ncbi:hypothetical protein H4R33_003944 [Dimargaris cristalligena]|nr:hypothetical protein H4R33_003944 [Dimargaris cristalligena]
MEPLTTLLLFCGAMFLGSLGVGLIPLSLSLCGSRLHMFSVFGSGLLLGTALLVIIPEGVDSLYKAMEPATKPLLGSDEHSDVHASESLLSAHQWIGLSLTLGFAWMFALDTLISILTNAPHHLHHGHTHGPCDSSGECNEDTDLLERHRTSSEQQHSGPNHSHSHSHSHAQPQITEISLTTTLSSSAEGSIASTMEDHSSSPTGSRIQGRSDGTQNLSTTVGSGSMSVARSRVTHSYHGSRPGSPDPLAAHQEIDILPSSEDTTAAEAETALFAAPPSGSASSKQRRSPTTTPTTTTTTNSHRHTHGTFTSLLSPATIGMLIHAAADGMALGSATATASAEADSSSSGHDHGHVHVHGGGGSSSGMSLIIFFAILLHKAPEAFGLCTQLLQEGQSRPAIKRTLVVFALAAPLMALATYAATGLVRLGAASTGPTDDGSAAESTILMRKFTALLLLFSAGTFLYVAAVHSLPETMCNDLPEEDTCDTHHHHHHHAAHPNPAGHPHSRMISTRSSIDLGGVESDLNPAPTSGLHFTQFRRHLLKRLGVLLVGMFLPLFISLGHSH